MLVSCQIYCHVTGYTSTSLHRLASTATSWTCSSPATSKSSRCFPGLPVDPPLLLDHSFVVADCDCTPPTTTSTSYCQVRNWRVLDVDAFAADLQSSELIPTPAEDIETGVHCYNSTQRSLLDKHAPVELKRVTTHSTSVRWYDRECRNVNQEIRASVSLTTRR